MPECCPAVENRYVLRAHLKDFYEKSGDRNSDSKLIGVVGLLTLPFPLFLIVAKNESTKAFRAILV